MRKLKSIILGWMYKFAVVLPPRLGIWLVNRSLPAKRPVLDYVEFHLVDHCNLNCAGCSHYAPYADRRFADVKTLQRDLCRLKELFSGIRHIRIMGGEPLLHDDVTEFVRIARDVFPASKIRVVTNGLKLLEKNSPKIQKFLECLKKHGVGVDWTCYPPVEGRRSEICALCREAGVDLRITDSNVFWARIRANGDADPAKSFRWCRRQMYCPFLDDGRLYLCAQAHFADYYNRAAGTSLPKDAGIDIHKATAREILLYLMRPSKACSCCDAGARYFTWKKDLAPEDWLR